MAGAWLYRPVARRLQPPANDLSALRSDGLKIEEDFHAAIRKASASRPAA